MSQSRIGPETFSALEGLATPVWCVDAAVPELLWANAAARALTGPALAAAAGAVAGLRGSVVARPVPGVPVAPFAGPLPEPLQALVRSWTDAGPADELEVDLGPGQGRAPPAHRARITRRQWSDGRPVLLVEAWPQAGTAGPPAAATMLSRSAAVLERVAGGAPLTAVLSDIIALVEAAEPGLLCSVVLLSGDRRRVVQCVGPGLPPEFRDSIVGVEIGPGVGSCGTAMFTGQRVIAADILTDPNWEVARGLAAEAGLRSCWSEPVADAAGRPIGSFAMYRRRPSRPDAAQIQTIADASRLARIAIETDRHRREAAEAEVRRAESEATLGSLLEAFPEVAFLKDREGRYRAVNARFCEAYGVSREAVLGRTATELFGAEAGALYARIDAALSPDRPHRMANVDDPALPGRVFSATNMAIVGRDGTPVGSGGVWVDVTEVRAHELYRRETERRLTESEAKFRLLFEVCPIGIAIERAGDAGPLAWNPAMAAMMGAPGGDTPASDVRRTLTAEARAQEEAARAALDRTGRHAPLEREIVRADGSRFSAILSGVMLERFDGAPALMTTVQDISAQKAAERSLRIQTDRLAMAMEAAGVGILDYDMETGEVVCNARMSEVFGVPELAGRVTRVERWMDLVHPEDRERVDQRVRRAFAGESLPAATFRICRPDGEIRHVCSQARVLFDEGRPVRVVGVNRDVTGDVRLAQALEERTEQAEQASRAKSRFLANMSHEIRTPLNGVMGGAQLLARSDLDPRQRDVLRVVETSGRALLELIEDLLDIGRIEAGALRIERGPVSLAELLSDTLDTARETARRKGLSLDSTLDPRLPPTIHADARRLRQVLVNLVGNAVKFTETGGITLAAAPGPGATVRFSVTDTGPGIPPEQQDAIFSRFAQGDPSLSRRHGGAGLGLAICRELVALMGGSIGVVSRPGAGARFWVSLPARPAGSPPG